MNERTGSGKSYTIGRLMTLQPPGRKALIVTSRENLVSQFSEALSKFFPEPDLTISSSDQSNKIFPQFLLEALQTSNVVITTLQGFQRNYKSRLLNGFDMVIFDEAHNLLSKDRFEMIRYLKEISNLELLFFTATPTLLYPHNESKLISVYELSEEPIKGPYLIRPIDLKRAIDLKVNVPIQIAHVIGLKPNLKQVSGEYNLDDAGKELKKTEYLQTTLEIYQEAKINNAFQVYGKYAMAFCASIDHAETMARYLRDHAWGPIEAHREAYEKRVREFIISKNFVGKRDLKSLRLYINLSTEYAILIRKCPVKAI